MGRYHGAVGRFIKFYAQIVQPFYSLGSVADKLCKQLTLGGKMSAAESVENGELYEFVASEKAAAQVQSIAEVLGGYDFVGLSGVQST